MIMKTMGNYENNPQTSFSVTIINRRRGLFFKKSFELIKLRYLIIIYRDKRSNYITN